MSLAEYYNNPVSHVIHLMYSTSAQLILFGVGQKSITKVEMTSVIALKGSRTRMIWTVRSLLFIRPSVHAVVKLANISDA